MEVEATRIPAPCVRDVLLAAIGTHRPPGVTISRFASSKHT